MRPYLEYTENAPRKVEAIHFSKYYLDYAALFLYATAEDIAEFIINYINIETDLENFKKTDITDIEKKRVTSKAGNVGIYLGKMKPQNNITLIVKELILDEAWKAAINYRNCWVHEKPPIIEGLGIQENRKNRIEISENSISMSIGGGDTPKYTLDELESIILKASSKLSWLINQLLDILKEDRVKIGEIFDFNKNSITIKLLTEENDK